MAHRAGAPARGQHRRRIAVSAEAMMTPACRPCRRRMIQVLATAALALGAWGFAPQAGASDEAAFAAAYNAAAEARKAVRKAGFEWRDLRTLLRESKKLGEKGEYEKAVELANQVQRQAELGLMQAAEQESAWETAVLK
ncbi:MAG: hypothetical protein OXC65_03555 [Thiotrichales bacterium]|nr:hypothetical protein [Thiotrichales bacterium]